MANPPGGYGAVDMGAYEFNAPLPLECTLSLAPTQPLVGNNPFTLEYNCPAGLDVFGLEAGVFFADAATDTLVDPAPSTLIWDDSATDSFATQTGETAMMNTGDMYLIMRMGAPSGLNTAFSIGTLDFTTLASVSPGDNLDGTFHCRSKFSTMMGFPISVNCVPLDFTLVTAPPTSTLQATVTINGDGSLNDLRATLTVLDDNPDTASLGAQIGSATQVGASSAVFSAVDLATGVTSDQNPVEVLLTVEGLLNCRVLDAFTLSPLPTINTLTGTETLAAGDANDDLQIDLADRGLRVNSA